MKNLLKLITSVLFFIPILALAQTQINPVTQIYWVNLTGYGAPTLTNPYCTLLNVGQPYTDLSNSAHYICMAPGGTPQWIGTGSINISGTPTTGQWAQWIDSTHLGGVTSIPYSALSGTPTIPTSADWPGTVTCTNQFISAIANGIPPTCSTVLYSQVSGTPGIFNGSSNGLAPSPAGNFGNTTYFLNASGTWSQVNIFNGTTNGLAPTPGANFGNTSYFLNANGSWSVPSTVGVTGFTASNLDPLFTTTVYNGTTTPYLVFSLESISANKVFAGPVSGGSSIPSFRSLVGADLPIATITSLGGVSPDGSTITINPLNGQISASLPTISILAKVNFTSCVLADDGNAGEGCTATTSWGSTLPSTYYMWCQTSTWPAGGTIGNQGGYTINIASQTTTNFTYTIDSRQDAARGVGTLNVSCWATN